jgi:hypothetical protein
MIMNRAHLPSRVLPAIWMFILALPISPETPVNTEPLLQSVRLYPENPTVRGAEAKQQFMVLGRFSDGLERDITTECRYSLSDPGVAKLSDSGSLEVLQDGTVELHARHGNLETNTSVTIRDTGLHRPFNFQRDIGGVFSKIGCNSATCHGGVKGKGGFKLSINSLYPEDDYKWVTRGGGYQVLTPEPAGEVVPRINVEDPEESLLLQKPTFEVPHKGGELISTDSREYQIMLDWIRAGAPYGEDDPLGKVTALEVYPGRVVLDRKGQQQLLVTAIYADGSREDYTDRVHFNSNDKHVIDVAYGGLITAEAPGETTITIRAAGLYANVIVGVIRQPVENYPQVPQFNLIDDHVFTKLEQYHILPSELSTDHEFIRRLCLDLAGTLPPPSRVREFLADNNSDKRAKLVEILLGSPEYVDFWTFRFSDLFRVSRNVDELSDWVRRNIARNIPYDQVARELVSAQGFGGVTRYYLGAYKTKDMKQAATEHLRLFMGRRFDCAECHNHPFDVWSQDQYWGITSFFSPMTSTELRFDKIVFDDAQGEEIDLGVGTEDATIRFFEPIQPRTKELIHPTLLDGTVLPENQRDDPRRVLAEWMTSHPYFAEAIVNRMWGYFFGRGITDPVDAIGSTNPSTNPELLAALAEDFRNNGHDLKQLMRRIVSSRTYQLSSIPNESNRHDEVNYSHGRPRPMEAEVLLDMITQVTGVPVHFKEPGGKSVPPGTRAVELKAPVSWESRFLEVCGRPNRKAIPERDGKASLTQAMHMLVGDTYNEQLTKEGGRIDRLMKSGLKKDAMIEELYLASLARYPTPEELNGIEEVFRKRSPLIEDEFFAHNRLRRDVLHDLAWALINAREFTYNH